MEIFSGVSSGSAVYIGGTGLYRLNGGEWEQLESSGVYSALYMEERAERLWFGTVDGIGYRDLRTGAQVERKVGVGFIWDLHVRDGQLWYFGTRGWGVMDLRLNGIGREWEHSFRPRPYVMGPWTNVNRVFIADSEAVYEATADGLKVVIERSWHGGKDIGWMIPDGQGFLFGGVSSVFRWSGREGERPLPIESNYAWYFADGVNNAVNLSTHAVIAKYPSGVVVWDKAAQRVSSLVGRDGGGKIGDIFKVFPGAGDTFFLLGSTGVAMLDLRREAVFYPAAELYGRESIWHVLAAESSGWVFTERNWIRLGMDGYSREPIAGGMGWVDLESSGALAIGSVSLYLRYSGGEWQRNWLQYPVADLQWGSDYALASGPDGLYVIDGQLQMRLVHPSDSRYRVLGEIAGDWILSGRENRLWRMNGTAGKWEMEPYQQRFFGEVVDRWNLDGEYLHLATTRGHYRVSRDRVDILPVTGGWKLQGLSANRTALYELYYRAADGKALIGVRSGPRLEVLEVPHLAQVGLPMRLVATDEHLGVVGEQGVLWIALRGLKRWQDFPYHARLMLGEDAVNGTTLPHGVHSLVVVHNAHEVNAVFEVLYRINSGDWRRLSQADPVLQFAGHGNFRVDLLMEFANGLQSAQQTYAFRILPPWYLRPLYQGMGMLLLLIAVSGIAYLRQYHLRQRNEWLQAEVKKQTRELEAATAARTHFLAGLSHDIRNPLNGVLMISETLSRNPPKDKEDARLADLREFGVMVDRMLGEILDFTTIDQSGLPLSISTVSIKDIVVSAVQQNQWAISRAGINVTVAIQPSLLESSIATDRNWVIQMLSNLIDNAVQYSGTESLEVGVRQVGGYRQMLDLEFFVHDWGSGIEDAEKPFVFERFYRGESGLDSGHHGTGLGLAICRDIARALGGELNLLDNLPRGCRFVFKGRFEEKPHVTELDSEQILQGLKGRRFLVVDDLRYNRDAVVEFLQSLGCVCDACDNGHEAVALLQQNRYYAALLDWDLPGLSGPEIARSHRRRFPQDPVYLIAVTAYTDSEKKAESLRVGMNAYISKPISANRFAHALAHLVPVVPMSRDLPVVSPELNREVSLLIDECILHGGQYQYEELRRCAHKLTTLALMSEDKGLQKLCRDLQAWAQDTNADACKAGLMELKKWRSG